MIRSSGNLAVLVCAIILGLAAGLGGAWLGLSRMAQPKEFSQSVSQLLEDGDIGLSTRQHTEIERLRKEYEAERRATGANLQTALVALAEAVVTSGQPDQVEAAANLVNSITHERRLASIAYITSARKVLDPDQRAIFDKAFLRVVTNNPSYSQ